VIAALTRLAWIREITIRVSSRAPDVLRIFVVLLSTLRQVPVQYLIETATAYFSRDFQIICHESFHRSWLYRLNMSSCVDTKGGLDSCGEEKIFLPTPGFLTRTVQSVASCYIDNDNSGFRTSLKVSVFYSKSAFSYFIRFSESKALAYFNARH